MAGSRAARNPAMPRYYPSANKEAFLKISIGAVAGTWTRSATMAFYDAVALSSVDVVYIGTTIHSPQGGLQKRDCLAVARELTASGKEVVLSVRAAPQDCDVEDFHTWIADSALPVEVSDARTFQLLAGKVPLVIGMGMPCENKATLLRLVDMGAVRWVSPAVCRGEFVRMVSYARDADCEIEQPVLSPRQFSRWKCRVDGCPYEGWALHSLPGCDRNADMKGVEPDWAGDLNMHRASGVSILRVTPKDVHDAGVSEILGELVRSEVDAREAYARYNASSAQTGANVTPASEPRRRRLAYTAGTIVR